MPHLPPARTLKKMLKEIVSASRPPVSFHKKLQTRVARKTWFATPVRAHNAAGLNAIPELAFEGHTVPRPVKLKKKRNNKTTASSKRKKTV